VKPRRHAAVVVALVALSAPGTAAAGDDAATVNGESISVDDFEAAVEESGVVDPATQTADAVIARTTLSELIAGAARVQFVRSYGMDADAETVADQLARLRPPDVADVGDVYADRPASLGVICARLMPVDDVDDGSAARDALAAGTPFVEVADRYSSDPGLVAYDGWLTGDAANPCVPLVDLQFDATIADAFVAAKPGVPAGPVVFDGAQGSLVFVIEIAELDEVASAIEAFYAGAEGNGTSAGELLFRGWFLDAEVTVNPRYGRWDPASGSIVPLGQ
jgi:hypothetical protein